MALSEFRYNKKRKHYSYIYGSKGGLRKNLVLSSKPTRKIKKRNGKYKIVKNIKLYKNPNPNKTDTQYIMTKKCLDHKDNFDSIKRNWSFHKNDKRLIKRTIKEKKV